MVPLAECRAPDAQVGSFVAPAGPFADASDDSGGARAGGELVVSRSAVVWSVVRGRAGGQLITGGSPDLSSGDCVSSRWRIG